MEEPTGSEIAPGLICFRGWVVGPNPIPRVTIEVGNHHKAIPVLIERSDLLGATGTSYAVGWQLYVHLSTQPPGRECLQVRIIVEGVCLLEQTLTCQGCERPQAVLEEPAGDKIAAGIVGFRGLVSGLDSIAELTLQIGDRSETVRTFHEPTNVLEATDTTRAVGWHLYAHIPSSGTGTDTLKLRVLVAGVCLLERIYQVRPRVSREPPRRCSSSCTFRRRREPACVWLSTVSPSGFEWSASIRTTSLSPRPGALSWGGLLSMRPIWLSDIFPTGFTRYRVGPIDT